HPLQLAADVRARIDDVRAFVFSNERAQPLFGAGELHGTKPFGVTAGLPRHPTRRVGARYSELALESGFDPPRLGLSVETQQQRLRDVEALVVATAERVDPLKRIAREP